MREREKKEKNRVKKGGEEEERERTGRTVADTRCLSRSLSLSLFSLFSFLRIHFVVDAGDSIDLAKLREREKGGKKHTAEWNRKKLESSGSSFSLFLQEEKNSEGDNTSLPSLVSLEPSPLFLSLCLLSPMAQSTRSYGKVAAAGAKAKAATVSKTSSPPIASVSKKPGSSSSSKKAPLTRRGGSSSLAATTATTTKKIPARSKKQKNTGKAVATAKAPKSSSSPTKTKPTPTSRRRTLATSSSAAAPSLSFPPPRRFLVGTALSVYQNSGGPDTNWSVFERTRAWGGLRPAVLGGAPCGRSSGFWDGRFDADAALAASVGSNCMRLSLEWSRVVPRPGQVDEGAIARYRDIFDSLERRGMEVLVTLHHFVHPSWLDESCGAFESEEGLGHFVEWSKVAFAAFGPRIASWCTFNEPGVFASSGYCTGFFPPGRVLRLRQAGEVLLRMLRAHTAAVKEMRLMSAAMHLKGRGSGGGGGGGGGGGAGTAKAPRSTAASAGGSGVPPRHSFGLVHNVMPYEAKPYFGVSGDLDLVGDTASIEQGFHSG